MNKLIYSAIMSLDGYIADETGSFDWAMPDEEVHTFINDLQRQIGTFLLGRLMYEVMVAWENPDLLTSQQPILRDFAGLWLSADKIVFSKTLEKISSKRTQIVRNFDPQTIRQLKATAGHGISIGGPDLAAHGFKAGLIDECIFFLTPIIIGGGKPALPSDIRLTLDLLDERRFGNGMVYLRYRCGW